MPVLPSYQRRVAIQPLNVRPGPEAVPAAFGAPIGGGLEHLGRTMEVVALEEKERADTLTVTEQLDRLNRAQIELQYGENGLMKRTRKNALGAREEGAVKMEEVYKSLMADLTPDQARLFEPHALNAIRSTDQQLAGHQVREMHLYSIEENESAIGSAIDLGVRTRDTNLAHGQIQQLVEEGARLTGAGPEQVKTLLQSAWGRMYGTIITDLISQRAIGTARKALEEYGKFMPAEVVAKLDDRLVTDEVRRAEQQLALKVWQAAGLKPEAANSILDRMVEEGQIDPEVLDGVRSRINIYEAQDNQNRINRERENWRDAFDIFQKNGFSMDAIPTSIDLTADQRNYLSNIEYNMKMRKENERNRWTDAGWEAFVSYMNLPGESRTVESAQKLWGTAPDHMVVSLVASAARGERAGYITKTQMDAMVRDTATLAEWTDKNGRAKSKEARERIAVLRQEFYGVTQEAMDNGRPFGMTEARDWLEKQTPRVAVKKPGWWNDPGEFYEFELDLRPELKEPPYTREVIKESPLSSLKRALEMRDLVAPTQAPGAPGTPSIMPSLGQDDSPRGRIITAYKKNNNGLEPTEGEIAYYLTIIENENLRLQEEARKR